MFSHAFGDALLKKDLAEDSRQFEIDLEKPIDVDCPVRIIHGLEVTRPKHTVPIFFAHVRYKTLGQGGFSKTIIATGQKHSQ